MDSAKNFPIQKSLNSPKAVAKEKKTREKDSLRFNERTTGEEIANALSHGIAAVLSVIGTVFMITRCNETGKSLPYILAIAAFGIGFVALYTTSFLYHSITNVKVKKKLQVLDHCMIYVMITGTYTPVCLNMIKGGWGYAIWGVNVACMILGIIVNLVDIHKYYRLSQALYILMGWMIVFGAVKMIQVIPLSGILYIVAGGILYTFSVIFYRMKDKKYMHTVFHLFVVAGSVPHFLFMWLYLCR